MALVYHINGMQRIRIDRTDDGVHAIWLDRPEKRNALDGEFVSELMAAFADESARAFVLASTDPRSFCAGADLTLPDAERAEVSDRLYELYGRMIGAAAPIVAVVDGPAVGGGAQLAIAADLRVAGPQASFRFAGPGHGLAVGSWGLPSLVGRGRAVDLCLTMRPVGADEALGIGLVDQLDDDPAEAALVIAADISMLDRDAAARVKRVVTEAGGLLAALERERSENRAAWSGSVEGL
jgi:enoyl-CoA hydratase